MVRAFLLAVSLFFFVPGLRAEPEPMAAGRKVNEGLLRVLEVGTEIYNKGDQAGCFRLYQGALLAAWPLLDGMPELQMKAKEGLKAAEAQGRFSEKAFTLRRTIDDLRRELGGGAAAGRMPAATKPLWERLGGEPAVTAVIDDFVARAAGNPKVNFTRKGTPQEWEATPQSVARLKKRLVQLVSVVSGGPLKYEGRDMKAAHQGMKITGAEFDALAGDLKATLEKLKVPAAEQNELLTIIASTRKDIVEEK